MRGLLLLAAGFGLGLVVAPQFNMNQGTPDKRDGLNFRSYKAGTYSPITKFSTTIMDSQADLQMYWAKNTGDHPSTAPTDVKWNEERLIAVNLGNRNTSGYRVFIKSIKRKDNNLVVTYVEKKPVAGMALMQVITSPWEIIRVPKVAGHIRFEGAVDNGLGGIVVIDTNPPCGCKCGCPCCVNGHR